MSSMIRPTDGHYEKRSGNMLVQPVYQSECLPGRACALYGVRKHRENQSTVSARPPSDRSRRLSIRIMGGETLNNLDLLQASSLQLPRTNFL